MGLFEHWPYSNFHELNLDWICRFVKKVRDRLDLIDKAVEDAQDARDKSEEFSLDSEAWAVGTKNGQPVDADAPQHENNSKYWADAAGFQAEIASDCATNAATEADNAEAWAKGTKNGVPVGSGDPQYENNAKYWADEAAASAADTTQADAAKAWAEQSEAWAVGTKDGVPVGSGDPQYENNSKYYAQQAAGAATAAVNTALAPVIADVADIKAKAWINFFGVVVSTGVVEKTPINGGNDIPGLFEFTIDDAPATPGYSNWGDFQYQPEAWKIVGADSPTDNSVNHIFYPYNYSLGSHNNERIFAIRVWDLSTGTWAVDGTTVSQFVVYLSQFTNYPYSTHGGRPINS